MGTCRLSREQFDALIESYRKIPGNISAASRAAGVDHRIARRALNQGWDRPAWARSISKLFEEEQVLARARLYDDDRERQQKAAELRKAQETASLDAVVEKAREAQGVRAAMSASMSALAVSGQLARARLEVSKKAAESIVQAAQQQQITWQEAIPLLVKLQQLDSKAVEVLKTSMDILRVHLGENDDHLPAGGVAEALKVHEVDGSAAARALGGEANLKQAVIDLAENRMTPLVERLVQYQLDQRTPARPS